MRKTLLIGAALAVCALAACTSSNLALTVATADADGAARTARESTGGVASPEDYRKEQTRKAMLGLNYDTGYVVVDQAYAANIAARGDVAAAEEQHAQALELLGRNEYVPAIESATRAVIMLPERAEFYDVLAKALMTKGRDREALAAYRTGVRLDESSVALRFGLAQTLSRLGEFAAATTEYRNTLALDASHGEAHARLGVMLHFAGDDEGARFELALAQQLGADVPAHLVAQLNGEDIHAKVSNQLPAGAPGFTVGPQKRIDVAGTTFASNETSAAASHARPGEIVGTWNDWRRSTGSEIINMGVAVSLDFGKTWTDFLVRPPPPNQSTVEGDPMTAYDHRTGDTWVGAISFAGNGGLYVARKVQGSTNFEPSVQVATESGADKCWMEAGPGVNDPNVTRLYIAYNRGLRRSTDGGQTWSSAVSLGSGIGFLPRVGPNGEVYVAYWDFGSGVKFARSLDGGQTISVNKTIATRKDTWGTQDGSRFAGNFRVPPMNSLAVDRRNGNLYCIFFDTTKNDPNVINRYDVDLYFMKSTDRGDTWTTPKIINGDLVPPGDSFWPWLEVDRQGGIHVHFHDSRHTPQPDGNIQDGWFDSYYSYSADGGDTWTEYRLTPESWNSLYDGLPRGSSQFIGDYSGLALAGNKAYPCYISCQSKNDSDIYINVVSFGLGDLNCDGTVDFGDINAFVLALSNPNQYKAQYPECDLMRADVNDDGNVDFGDINAFVELLSR